MAAGAVLVVAGGVRRLTGWSHPFIPFLTAFVIVLGGAHYTDSLILKPSLDAFFNFVLLIVNTFVLFYTAIGGQEFVIQGAKGELTGLGETQSGVRKGFFDSWIRGRGAR